MTPEQPSSAAEDAELAGRVIASHGRRVIVETPDGRRIACAIRGRELQVYCGDEVRWRYDTTDDRGIVLQRLPRRSVLERTNSSGGSEVIVANLSQIVVIVAHEPQPDFFIVDRFMAAAELSGLHALLVHNKIDAGESRAALAAELTNYEAIGYPVLRASGTEGTGIAEVQELLRDHVSVLVGQSGVGKSSLANQLVPGLEAATAALSAATEEGRHVTSVSTLHHLPTGGDLIDSPGVRDFAPAIDRIDDPTRAFREFIEPGTRCRFGDCRHLREPDCAVRAAVDAGAISARRYESFKRLGRLREQLAPAPGRQRR